MTNQTHVVPSEPGGWNIRQDDAKRASAHFDTKEEAVQRAREISRNEETELVIHNRDGAIGTKKDSHGKDRNPPRG